MKESSMLLAFATKKLSKYHRLKSATETAKARMCNVGILVFTSSKRIIIILFVFRLWNISNRLEHTILYLGTQALNTR